MESNPDDDFAFPPKLCVPQLVQYLLTAPDGVGDSSTGRIPPVAMPSPTHGFCSPDGDSVNCPNVAGAKRGTEDFRGKSDHLNGVYTKTQVVANALFECTDKTTDVEARRQVVQRILMFIDCALVNRYTASSPSERIYTIVPGHALVLFAYTLPLQEGQTQRLCDALSLAMLADMRRYTLQTWSPCYGPFDSFAVSLSRALDASWMPASELGEWYHCAVPYTPIPTKDEYRTATGTTFMLLSASTAAAAKNRTGPASSSSSVPCVEVYVEIGLNSGMPLLASISPWSAQPEEAQIVVHPNSSYRVLIADYFGKSAFFKMRLVGLDPSW